MPQRSMEEKAEDLRRLKSRLCGAQQRCKNKNSPRYRFYGERGIRCLVSIDELVEIWNRDRGWLLKDPTMDRKDNDGNYDKDNIRFIERKENSSKGGFNDIRSTRTSCVHGHKLTKENLYVDAHGVRKCKICRQDDSKRFKLNNPNYNPPSWR